MDSDKNNLPSLFQNSFSNFIKSFDSFFEESFRHYEDFFNQSFAVTSYETGSDMVIEAELLGCRRDQIQIKILPNGQLKISVENANSTEEETEEGVVFFKNQSLQQYERIITLPYSISDETAKASFKDGVLRIIMSKGKQTEKTIEIE